ncbi:nuclease-related domain-containing protein [Vibrio maerlii]|uniref:nuclease-related domain-containing protein n=1 Tax=Vibrio maerlii TaxID=2231648 RepID=UPI000E3C33FB|nr:nuclease-related domain-containing protein [Vibrio maerlii]
MFNVIKGWFGEKKTALSLWASLDSNVYHRFHDIYVPTFNGTAQIDHLLISRHGIFIVETKNLKGWIFGNERASQWTQNLFGSKYRFQNPLRQTYRQKKALAKHFALDEEIIETVVVLTGDCELRTDLPRNVLVRGLGRYIKRFKYRVLSDSEVISLVREVENHKKQYHDQQTTCAEPSC